MKKIIIISITTVVILLVTVVFLIINYSSTNDSHNGLYEWVEKDTDKKYTNTQNKTTIPDVEDINVDELINKLINSEEYSKMSDNEKKEACEKLLKDLKEKEAIKNYSYSDMLFSFEYKNGTLGGIQLKDWNPIFN